MASKKPARPAYVAPVPGLPVRVIKDGGTWDHAGVIQSVDQDDEVLGGTWMTIVVDPDLPERMQLSALRLDTEQDCRDRSERDRRRYFTWCVE